MTGPLAAAARTPPDGLDGLDPAWSRLVRVPGTDGVGRTWHLLDNGVDDARLTVLCVHGNPSWSYLFRKLVGRAPDRVRVIAVDQLEMGFSERSGRVRRLATRVDDLCALTDELGLDGPVVTVAHDWGGPISLGWAQRHRDQLVGVVLMNTAVHQPEGSPAPSLIRLTRSRPMLQNITVRTTSFIRGALAMSRPRPSAEVQRGFLAPYLSADRRSAIAEFVADIPLDPEHPSASALDAIAAGLGAMGEVPTLLLWGSRDKVFSDLYLHDLERRLPHADVHRYPKAGHFVSEDVDAVGAIVDWLGALDRRCHRGVGSGSALDVARHTRRTRCQARRRRAARRRGQHHVLRVQRTRGGDRRGAGGCRRGARRSGGVDGATRRRSRRVAVRLLAGRRSGRADRFRARTGGHERGHQIR